MIPGGTTFAPTRSLSVFARPTTSSVPPHTSRCSLANQQRRIHAKFLSTYDTLRRALAGTDPMAAMKMLLERLQKFPTHEAFLKSF
jgi:hypothetical protein